MITIPRADWRTWTYTHGLVWLHVACPQCKHDFPTRIDEHQAADEGHRIDDAGNVHPSLVCPFTGCDFHGCVTLAGWQDPANSSEANA